MMEVLKGSFEEDVADYPTQEDCLVFIAEMMKGYESKTRVEKVEGAKKVLATRLLPHLGIDQNDETVAKKAFFTGYMVHRLCTAALGRATEDDRDHYGKKRLELNGALLETIFKNYFKIQRMAGEKYLGEYAKQGRAKIDLQSLFPSETITKNLRGALATGNWPGS
mmetsp:Transcript_25512/g.22517  ORF Transcript_25512/g.22517 Transcript_25512/m.22517 type:complete len:166 (-) Transcript_25512:1494-1991(-)